MSTVARLLKILIRLSGGTALLIGLVIWTGHGFSWLPLHILLGVVLVISMWVTAVLALSASTRRGLAVLVLVWGAGVVAFGRMQGGLLPGPMHWMVSLTHLLLGGVGIGLGAALAGALADSTVRAVTGASMGSQ